MMKLYETYENCQSEIGKVTKDRFGRDITPLLPIAHTTQNAHIELTIDGVGDFVSARALDKAESVTIIPCTESSANRTSSPVCHPLFDKLQYLAADYTKYGGEKGAKCHEDYMIQLKEWCDSPYANEKIKAIYAYLAKGKLIADLIKAGALICGDDGKLLPKWKGKKEEQPQIFKSITGNQIDAFIRFCVNIPGDFCPEVWKDHKVHNDYINQYLHKMDKIELCYVTGTHIVRSDMHPAKIRNTADKAKLISGNDTDGFTFRGRFTDKNQVASVGYEVSQKAHNALKWLIAKQGFSIADRVFLTWGTNNERIPYIMDDSKELLENSQQQSDKENVTDSDDFNNMLEMSFSEDSPEEAPEEIGDLTEEGFAHRLNQAMRGYHSDLDHHAQVMIIGLDAATTGRLAITFYRELGFQDFLERIQSWHTDCSWMHHYGYDKDKKKKNFVGAPSPNDIDFAAFGKRNEKLSKMTVERILHCIVDHADIPQDIVQSAIRRASNPVAFEPWEWNKILTIACSLYRVYKKRHDKEDLKMSLDESRTDRNYLYGRMLAVADWVENSSYETWGERETNAVRYMNALSQKPYRTWAIIEKNLQPYFAKLNIWARKKYRNLLDEINDKFEAGDYESEKPLEGLYLHGYHCQLQFLRNQAAELKEQKKKNEETM